MKLEKKAVVHEIHERHEQKQALVLRVHSAIGWSLRNKHVVDYFRVFRDFRG